MRVEGRPVVLNFSCILEPPGAPEKKKSLSHIPGDFVRKKSHLRLELGTTFLMLLWYLQYAAKPENPSTASDSFAHRDLAKARQLLL